jgi:hypothetical protein
LRALAGACFPHLAALAILLDTGKAGDVSAVSITVPAGAAKLIGQMRASGAILTYDPDTCTIRSADSAAVAVTTGRSH